MPVTATLAATLTRHERAFGDYGPNRWAWRLADVHPLDQPIPARGALSLWDWEPPSSVREMLDLPK